MKVMKVASILKYQNGGENRQEQADHRPYLTPERAVGGNVGTATLDRWLGSCR